MLRVVTKILLSLSRPKIPSKFIAKHPSSVPLVFFVVLFTVMLALTGFLIEPMAFDSNAAARGFFLADSIGYLETSRDFSFSEFFVFAGEGQISFSSLAQGGTNVLLHAQGYLAWELSPTHPYIVIFLINVCVLIVAGWLYLRAAKVLQLHLTATGLIFLLLNPMIWMSTVSLTKEIWGVLFIAALVYGLSTRNMLLISIAAILAFWIRGFYTGVAVALAATLKIHPVIIVVALAIGLGVFEQTVGDQFHDFRTIRAIYLGQQTGALMKVLGDIQSYPLGHLIAGPIVLVIHVLSPALNPEQYRHPLSTIYVHAMTISSFYAVITLAIIAFRRRAGALQFSNYVIPLNVLLMFVTFLTIFPVSQHRFLIPVMPLIGLIAVAHSTKAHRNDS